MNNIERVKISTHFYLDEFFDKSTYLNNTEQDLKSMINMAFITDLEQLRVNLDVSFTVNNWWSGGIYQWRGLRNPNCKQYKKGSEHSKEPLSCCDFQCKVPSEQVRIHIKTNYHLYPSFKRLEKGVSWVHVDCKETNIKGIYEFSV